MMSSRFEPALGKISFAESSRVCSYIVEQSALEERKNKKEQEIRQASALQKLEKQIFTQT